MGTERWIGFEKWQIESIKLIEKTIIRNPSTMLKEPPHKSWKNKREVKSVPSSTRGALSVATARERLSRSMKMELHLHLLLFGDIALRFYLFFFFFLVKLPLLLSHQCSLFYLPLLSLSISVKRESVFLYVLFGQRAKTGKGSVLLSKIPHSLSFFPIIF